MPPNLDNAHLPSPKNWHCMISIEPTPIDIFHSICGSIARDRGALKPCLESSPSGRSPSASSVAKQEIAGLRLYRWCINS